MSFERKSRLFRAGASSCFGHGLGFALLAWAAFVGPLIQGRAAGVRLLDSAVAFAAVEEARSVLTNRDGFVAALSPFDRAARLKVDREVSETEFLAHVAASARSWAAPETNEINRACLRIAGQLAGWHVPLPPAVLFIKTSGAEEGHAAYTRQHAVVLPQRLLDEGKGTVPDGLLLHELFHIVSRHDPGLRRRLYDQVGFRPIPAVEYPPSLRDRKITNPDGYETGWVVNVTNQNRTLSVLPVLYAERDRYDPSRGGEFFDYMAFKLMVLGPKDGRWMAQLRDGQPQLLDVAEVAGYFEQVGRNTQYLIHPDEILADNFVLLIQGRTDVASPTVLAALGTLLRPAAKPAPAP